MRRIDIEHMKIEHWFPENELSDIERLDYRNMLGSCEGHIDGTYGKKMIHVISINLGIK